ncbi:hypothetical protein WQ57_19860 [Mesobacillus campisalis]|uniref:Uncharacterized protein n=1 Tax=Mesobacillus campisalis TaxID=1408103 RepID=A0A0M2SQ44_9BACI|nr:hypothetical protein [Mesobacillus campisalis]KKK36343.1 hypothetical protein WQ57_19860 [Mesobacillus campisalis]
MGSFFVGSIMSGIGFLTISLFFWGLIVAAGLGFVLALLRRSWKGFMFSGTAFLIPGIVLASQEGYYYLFLFFSPLAFIMAILFKSAEEKGT